MFRDLRDEADSWSRARTEYMIPLLRTGRHPDTDPTFWNGRRPTPPPSLWMTPPGYVTVLGVTLNPTQQLGAVTASVAAVLTVAGVGTALGLRRARRRRSSHSPAT
jgi:hypothetical protein